MRSDTTVQTLRPRRQAVLYARVSSKDQERGGFSIQAQQQLLRAYARQRGFEIAEAFIDVETAGKAGRANFGAMLRYVRRHPRCRAILVEKTDRLYRNIKDWVALEELGLDVHLVKEGVVLSDESMSAEKFVHGIKVLVAKNYIDNLSEETKKGLLEKARQGLWPSRAPLGYKNIVRRDGKHVIEPDAERAPIIAKVFEWYATGEFPLTALTTKARQAGLTYRKSKRPLGRSRIHKLLHDPIYMGDFIWDGQRYEGSHEPIVSRETWGDVQSVLTGRAPRRRPRQERGSGHAFAGLVSCWACADDGRHFMLIGEAHKARHVYYRCERCKRHKRAVYVREQDITAAYAGALGGVTLPAAILELLVATLHGKPADGADERPSELDRLRAERDDLAARIDIAYEDRLARRIDVAYFEERAKRWRARIAELEREIEHAEQASSNNRSSELELRQPAELFRESENPLFRRQLIGILHSNSTWRAGKLEVKWRQPAEIRDGLMEG